MSWGDEARLIKGLGFIFNNIIKSIIFRFGQDRALAARQERGATGQWSDSIRYYFAAVGISAKTRRRAVVFKTFRDASVSTRDHRWSRLHAQRFIAALCLQRSRREAIKMGAAHDAAPIC
jgi:hypothetical protein